MLIDLVETHVQFGRPSTSFAGLLILARGWCRRVGILLALGREDETPFILIDIFGYIFNNGLLVDLAPRACFIFSNIAQQLLAACLLR
jgi:hypothetical protein